MTGIKICFLQIGPYFLITFSASSRVAQMVLLSRFSKLRTRIAEFALSLSRPSGGRSHWYLEKELRFGMNMNQLARKNYIVPKKAVERSLEFLSTKFRPPSICRITFAALLEYPKAFGIDITAFLARCTASYGAITGTCSYEGECFGGG